jgi:hypothetical protein
MPLHPTIGRILFVATLLLPATAGAQQRGELTLFSNPGYTGFRYTVTGPSLNVRLPWTARSAIVAPGDQWQLCTDAGYEGQCTILRDNTRNLGFFVASARPAGPTALPNPIPGGVTTLPAPIPPDSGFFGPSLRGMTAEFFRAPASGGQRVASCPTGGADCAAQVADRFCRSRGWTASSYQRQETVAGRIYLADVLCTRTG